MLNKLLRYELKCTRRTFLPMLAAMVLLTLLTKSMELLCSVFSFIKIPYTIMFAVNLVLLVLSVFAAILFLIQRFYKNMTGPEGYLMFSLPVRVVTHLFSKWLISIFWIFVTAACGVGLGVLLIPSDQYMALRAFMDTADLTLRQTMGLSLDRMVSLLVLYLGISASAFMAVIYGAVSIGQLARSSRAFASVGGYLIFYAVQQALNLLLVGILFLCYGQDLFVSNPTIPQGMMPVLFGGVMVTELLVGYLAFYIAGRLFSKRLNLE